MSNETTYTITMDTKQVRAVVKALDLFSRIHMRQLTEVAEVLRFSDGMNPKDIAVLRNILDVVARPLVIPDGSHGHYGITSKEISNDARVAWDIQQALRHCVAWTENPEGGHGVSFYTPLVSSGLPLPEVVANKKGDSNRDTE